MSAPDPAESDFEPVPPDDDELDVTKSHPVPPEAIAPEWAEPCEEPLEADAMYEVAAYEAEAEAEGDAAEALAAYEKSRGRDPTQRLDDFEEQVAVPEGGGEPAEWMPTGGTDQPAQRTEVLASPLAWPALITVAGVFLVLLAGAMGSAFWFYQARIAPRLDRVAAAPVPEPAPAPAPVPVPVPPTAAVDLSPLQASLASADSRIAGLQKQLETEREARLRSDRQLQEMSARVSDMILKQSSLLGPGGMARAPKPDASGMPAVTPALTPSVSELVLLKERNRLAAYADEAIANGRRDALQAIVDAMLDPAMKQLHFAAQAEFKRVQSYYNFSISIDPGYTLPVHEMFKGPSIRSEKDLAPAQLTRILLDHQQPWEARLRSAFLLRTSTEADTDRALLRAMKEDPSLDVAKQAQTTFEKLVGRKFRLFDIPAIEVWWQMQGNLLLAPPAEEKGR